MQLWVQLPLPEVRYYNTLVEFCNGDKICVDKTSDVEHPTLGVYQNDAKKFHTSGKDTVSSNADLSHYRIGITLSP